MSYSSKKIALLTICMIFTAMLVNPLNTKAQEIGHYAPGVFGIRDFIAPPEPGLYFALYSYRYTTDRLNDGDGNEVDIITIDPDSGPVELDLDVDVAVGVLAPTLIWISEWEVLGARYGAYISPALSNTSIGAALSAVGGSGRSSEKSQFGFGDLFVQPLWLTWSKEHTAFSFAYGVYIPVGKYDTETVTLPNDASLTVAAADNIGMGFWTHQFQGGATWFPWSDQRMAVATALTYEIHGEKKDFDIKPGSNLALNWGVSQYLPLKEDQTLLLELGPAGYFSWQVSEDSGSEAANPSVKDHVNAIGGQIGLTMIPWNATLNFHFFYEYSAVDRFQGQSIGINLGFRV